MKVKGHFDHFNVDVVNLERSIHFYEEALGLHLHHKKEASDGSFILAYMADDNETFLLELTWLRDHLQPFELGENESHLCLRVEGDYDKVREFHRQMGCICYENEAMGLYFIHDPDDYWIEILPVKE